MINPFLVAPFFLYANPTLPFSKIRMCFQCRINWPGSQNELLNFSANIYSVFGFNRLKNITEGKILLFAYLKQAFLKFSGSSDKSQSFSTYQRLPLSILSSCKQLEILFSSKGLILTFFFRSLRIILSKTTIFLLIIQSASLNLDTILPIDEMLQPSTTQLNISKKLVMNISRQFSEPGSISPKPTVIIMVVAQQQAYTYLIYHSFYQIPALTIQLFSGSILAMVRMTVAMKCAKKTLKKIILKRDQNKAVLLLWMQAASVRMVSFPGQIIIRLRQKNKIAAMLILYGNNRLIICRIINTKSKRSLLDSKYLLNYPRLNVTLVSFIRNLKTMTTKQNILIMIVIEFVEQCLEKSSKKPRNDVKTISTGKHSKFKVYKRCSSYSGQTNPSVEGFEIYLYYQFFHILNMVSSSVSTLLITFSINTSLILTDLALTNIYFNLSSLSFSLYLKQDSFLDSSI